MSAPLDPSCRSVAVVAAMVPELAPLVRRLRLRRTELGSDPGGPATYEGEVGDRHVVATVTSMGPRAATAATERLLDAGAVDHVLAIGIAGAVAEHLAIGALLVPEAVVDEASGRRLAPTPLGTMAASGTLLTTDHLHNTPDALAELRRQDVVAVDMETAAIGAVAHDRGIPWSVLRAISDRAGDPDVDDRLLAMSHPDGSPRPAGVAAYLVRRPHRLGKLARLGRGMRAAVHTSTEATLTALGTRS